MRISEWPVNERPREKLLKLGAQSLSDAELLALFIGSGVRGENAVDLARHLLADFGGLRALLAADQQTFCQRKGLGVAKYCQIQAALELSHRHLKAGLTREYSLTSTQGVRDYVCMRLHSYEREVFACVFLDTRYQVISFEALFFGTINQASIHPREVVKSAMKYNASSIVLAHNHPSGDPTPSAADQAITQLLIRALETIDIVVVDHIIVGAGQSVSLVEWGFL